MEEKIIMKKILITGDKRGTGKSSIAFNLAYGLAIEGRSVGILEVYRENSFMVSITGGEIEKYKKPEIMQGLIKLMVISEEETDKKLELFSEKEWSGTEYIIIDSTIKNEKITEDRENIKAIIVTESESESNEYFNILKSKNIEIIGVVENKVEKYKREIDINSNIISRIPFEDGLRKENFDGIPYIYKNYKTNGITELKELVDRVIDFEYGEEESAIKKIKVGVLIDKNKEVTESEERADKIAEIKINGMLYKVIKIKEKFEKNSSDIILNGKKAIEKGDNSIEGVLNLYIEELNRDKRHSCH